MTTARWSRLRSDIRTPTDAARAIAANPPAIPGWELVGPGEPVRGSTTHFVLTYEDDDGALAFVTLGVSALELDESRVPPDRENGDGT